VEPDPYATAPKRLSYELRPGGNRPGPGEMWDRFDAIVAQLVRAQAGTDFAAIADGYRMIGELTAELADAVDRERSPRSAKQKQGRSNVLRLMRLWLLLRIGRVVLPLLIAVVLLGELATSIHRHPVISPPRSMSPITTVIRHHSTSMIARARRDLTRTLEREAPRR
jgi:hypothetical protein